MWVVLRLKTEADILAFGRNISLKTKDMATGCCGCLLVFDAKEDASACAGEGGSIIQVEIASLSA